MTMFCCFEDAKFVKVFEMKYKSSREMLIFLDYLISFIAFNVTKYSMSYIEMFLTVFFWLNVLFFILVLSSILVTRQIELLDFY